MYKRLFHHRSTRKGFVCKSTTSITQGELKILGNEDNQKTQYKKVKRKIKCVDREVDLSEFT